MNLTCTVLFRLPFMIYMVKGEKLWNIKLLKEQYEVIIKPPGITKSDSPPQYIDPERVPICRSISLPGGGKEEFWKANSLIIVVSGHVEDRADLDHVARRHLGPFLRAARARTGQYQINQPGLGPVDCTSTCKDENGNRVGSVTTYVGADLILDEPKYSLRASHWKLIEQDLVQEIEPALWWELLLDARSMLRLPRRSVLEAAIANELFVKEIIRTHSKDPLYAFVVQKRLGMEDWFSILSEIGYDMKTQHQDIYNDIIHLVQARNNVAHRGACEYRMGKRGRLVNVDTKEAARLIDSLESFTSFVLQTKSAIRTDS